DGFLFVGNHLFLEFINTRPEMDGKPEELLNDWGSLIRWFHAADLMDSREGLTFERTWAGSNEARKTLRAMRECREEVRTDLFAWEKNGRVRTETLRDLNDLMSRHPMLTTIRSEARRLVTAQWFPVREPSNLFAPLANAAANLFSQVNPK